MRRRLSISAPRMIVRSHIPWPIRWAMLAVALGFSAAIALWAFEFGKEIAGLDRNAQADLVKLREQVALLQAERQRAQAIANTADSLLRSERAAQERLSQQLKDTEAENLALKADLGFFEHLLPANASTGLSIRNLQVERKSPGQIRFQLLVMQAGRASPEFRGRYEVTLLGTLDGKLWSFVPPDGTKPLQVKQVLRLEGLLTHPAQAVIKTVQIRVFDAGGALKAMQIAKL